jgi:ornithine carbamoyltransferase
MGSQCFAMAIDLETSNGLEISGLNAEEQSDISLLARFSAAQGSGFSYDVFTYIEHRGSIAGKCVAWVGDANNMLYSWLQAAEVFGFHLNVSTPVGYDINPALVSQNNLRYTVFKNPADACAGADLVTTDVWTSMGYEQENVARLKAFDGWIVDSAKMQRANPDALFMHCLPAHRGEEVAAEVIDGPQSVVWDEAENRLHVQKALLEYLVLGKV